MKAINFWGLCLLILNGFSIKAQAQSGYAMLGAIGKRDAKIWYHQSKTHYAQLEYWPSGDPVSVYKASISLDSAFGYCGTFELSMLTPGRKYEFRINQHYQGSFTTQSLWEWRTDPPALHIAFGSCAYLNDPDFDRPGKSYGGEDEIFNSIANKNPDAMIWLGDNVYFREGDWESLLGMIHRYRHLRSLPELQRLLTTCPHYAVWDDHDFGPNDATGSWPLKRESLEAFKLFWTNPSYGMPEFEGISTAFRVRDVDVFLVDNRYHRTHHALADSCDRRMLGQAQINWLVEALKYSRAPFKLVVCGSQVLNSEAVHETFANYPCEQAYLLQRLADEKIHNLVFLTGDRHHSEQAQRTVGGVVFHEITSSPLTSGVHNQADEENNRYRVPGSLGKTRGYATLRFSGPTKKRSMLIRFHNQDGKIYYESTINSLNP